MRSALLLNKFDNPLTGVRFDSGEVGTIINVGNVASAGSFWSAKTCTAPLRDNTIATASPVTTGALAALVGVTLPPVPVYPPPPHCNTRGLTELGAHVVDRLMDKRMIVNPDHMSQAAVDATLKRLEARSYSGVISPHGWMDPGNWPRLWKLGGLAWPGHSNADRYVAEWKSLRPKSTPFMFGWGYGAYLGSIPDMAGGVRGVRLTGVRADSPADHAGIRAGDVIVRIGEHEVADLQGLTDALRAHQPGDAVDLVLLRDGAERTVRVTLGRRGG